MSTTTTVADVIPPERTSIRPRRPAYTRIIQNYLLVWLDSNIDSAKNTDFKDLISKLKEVVNNVNTFTNIDECISFMSDLEQEKTFMIVSGALEQSTVPIIHNIPQLIRIYILDDNQFWHEGEAEKWPKISGVYKDVDSIIGKLQLATYEYDQSMASISFVPTSSENSLPNLDQLDSSFMYTQIMKEILFTIDFDQQHINGFITNCRHLFAANSIYLEKIDQFEREYYKYSPIWWYTSSCFVYSMLNRSLRMMEVNLIISMGFFIRDLHNHIAKLHVQQFAEQSTSNSFTLYRGQGMSKTEFDRMVKTCGGLLSFNCFLSTSLDRELSLAFAESNQLNLNLIGVLFVITVNPSTLTTVFANVQDVSYFRDEEEILFSMHSIFRIGPMKRINGNNRLWQVDLTLTSDNDPDLHSLTERLREETNGSTGWFRLGKLMIKLAQYNEAKNLYEVLLTQRTNEDERGNIFFHLGLIKLRRGEYEDALTFYERSLDIRLRNLSSQHPCVAECYNDIGLVYKKMRENSKALSYYEKALEIRQKTIPPTFIDLAESYNNIGALYKSVGQYSNALLYYQKALEIRRKCLPSNHMSLATSYNNIGVLYANMFNYAEALSYYKKDLEICERILPPNHHDLANSYNNIGWMYRRTGDCRTALTFFERALHIRRSSLPPEHPSVQALRGHIESVKAIL